MVHVFIHAHPCGPYPRLPYLWRGVQLQRLDVPSSRLTRPLCTTFDNALGNLQQIEDCSTELDGSFFWKNPAGRNSWQFDGQLNDSAIGLMTVELKINYDSSATAAVNTALDKFVKHGLAIPPTHVIYQLVRQGVYVTSLVLTSPFEQ